jgi:hypothetical protein
MKTESVKIPGVGWSNALQKWSGQVRVGGVNVERRFESKVDAIRYVKRGRELAEKYSDAKKVRRLLSKEFPRIVGGTNRELGIARLDSGKWLVEKREKRPAKRFAALPDAAAYAVSA